jgi:hypothetical protein
MDGDRAFAHKYVHFGERGAFAIRGGKQRHRKRGATQPVCDTEKYGLDKIGIVTALSMNHGSDDCVVFAENQLASIADRLRAHVQVQPSTE